MQLQRSLAVFAVIMLLSACVRAPTRTTPTISKTTSRPTFTPAPTGVVARAITATRTESVRPTPTVSPSREPASTATQQPTATASSTHEPTSTATRQPTATASATPEPTAVPPILVEVICTPYPEDQRMAIDQLPVGQTGQYINLAFGYWLQYPPSWYTHFGRRPLLVSFSNLDPGTHNRESMRDEGCLIEVNASVNIPGFNFSQLQAQLPQVMSGAQAFALDGEPALRLQRRGTGDSFDGEWIYVQRCETLFLVSVEYSRAAPGTCLSAWEQIIDGWKWFEPALSVYRNREYGYAVSYPRQYHRFNPRDEGVWISSQDPAGMRDFLETPKIGMLVETDVLENPENLTLDEWVAMQDWYVESMRDVPLDGLLGIQLLRQGPSADIQETSGYFMGPLGRVYVVRCLYPLSREWEFRPIANAIIYSFGF